MGSATQTRTPGHVILHTGRALRDVNRVLDDVVDHGIQVRPEHEDNVEALTVEEAEKVYADMIAVAARALAVADKLRVRIERAR